MNGKRIIIADDEAPVLRILTRALRDGGYEVIPCHNGKLAFEQIMEGQPDALITDIEMPVMTGEELCRQLVTALPDREFPIFVSTSVTATTHRDWSGKIPNLTFFEKPLSTRILLDTLAAYFNDAEQQTIRAKVVR